MATWLKQSTTPNVGLGPFLDDTDGKTAETGLTITQADVRLKKNDGGWAQKSDTASAVHQENGWYAVALDTTDTNTLGILLIAVHKAGALPVWREFLVVPANVYDSFFSTDKLQVDVVQIAGIAQTGVDLAILPDTIAPDLDDIQTRLPASLVSGRMNSSVGAVAAGVINAAAINADTDIYSAKLWLIDDDGGTNDRYIVAWYKNGEPVITGITSPTIQVVKASDGTDLIASTAMTEIGSTGIYKKDEATNRIVDGALYFVDVRATIASVVRKHIQPVGRDS